MKIKIIVGLISLRCLINPETHSFFSLKKQLKLSLSPLLSSPQERFTEFANAGEAEGQLSGRFAVHTDQVWLIDQVATPLWSQKERDEENRNR